MTIRSLTSAMLLLLPGCDQSFNPKGEFEKTLAVYGVLSTSSDTILIRVSHTYDPSGFDPFDVTDDPTVPDAVVEMFKEDSAYSIRDTVLSRTDSSRYSTNIKVYEATGLSTEFGRGYSINVSSPTYGTFHATTTLPGKGLIVLSNSFVLDYPKTFRKDTLFLAIHLSPVTRGYLLRAYLEYDYPQGSQTLTQRMEVPVYRAITGNGVLYDPQFPLLRRRTSSPTGPGIESGPNDFFQVGAFLQTADLVHALHPYATVRRALFVVNQVEPNFYNYYNVVNGFRDGRSLRVDEPSFSNIPGGEGVFGGFTVEDISYDLPVLEYN